MALRPDPIFFQEITRDGPSTKVAFFIENTAEHDCAIKFVKVERPPWLFIDQLGRGGSQEVLRKGFVTVLPARSKSRFVARANAGHPDLPSGDRFSGDVGLSILTTLRFDKDQVEAINWEDYEEDERDMSVPVRIQRIVSSVETFHGVLAVDFGTTNTCYAYRPTQSKSVEAYEAPPIASREIPSAVYFQKVDEAYPRYVIGERALNLISQNTHRIYSYFLGLKRVLGQNHRYFVLDSESGRFEEQRADWSAEEIAAFFIKQVLEEAQNEFRKNKLGTRIREVVATFPTLFSPRRKAAIKNAFNLALEKLEGPNKADVKLHIDEANAATFNYITGALLDQFLEMAVEQDVTNLLTFDFGGGTIDVSFMKVELKRNDDDTIKIFTELLGVTGEDHYGGDNVTLAVFKLLKRKLALAVANERHKQPELSEEEEPKDEKPKSLWDDDDDDWGDTPAKEPEPEAEVEEAEPERHVPPEYAEFVNDDDATLDGRNTYLETLKELLESGEPADDTEEAVIPTRWSVYSNRSPHKELLAKKFFYEIWLEAEKLKLMLVKRKAKSVNIQAPLERIAFYAGVDPQIFNDNVKLTLEEVQGAVEEAIVSTIQKAKTLVDVALKDQAEASVVLESDGDEESDDDFGGVLSRYREQRAKQSKRLHSYAPKTQQPTFKLLLAGNASSLPLVQSKINEIFELEPRDLLRPKNLKSMVAQGAASEMLLRREFGSQGYIHFESRDFLNRLPYSLGMYSRFVGFQTIFQRGSNVGDTVVFTNERCRLIHEEIQDLGIFADFHDGTKPVYIGRVDFKAHNKAKTREPEPTEDSTFRIEFELQEDRHFVARKVVSGEVYDFQPNLDEDVDAAADPFSGFH